MSPMLSVVVPAYNEAARLGKNLPLIFKFLNRHNIDSEVIVVDDGSTDKSLEILKTFEEKDKNVRVYSFRKNLGKSEALTYGFMQAKGDYVVTLDADLQDQPSEISKLLAKAGEGIEVVCGWRKDRKDKSNMKFISKIFNNVLKKLFGLDIHDYNCGLKVYTKEAAKSLRLYGGLHRFIPLLAYQQGFAVDEVAVHHEPRKFGKSKYGFSKVWKDLPDIFSVVFLANFSKRPLHFFGPVGGVIFFTGVIVFTYLSLIWLQGESIGTRPLFFVSIFLILGGLQILFTGFLADLIINIAHTQRTANESLLHFPLKYKSDKE